MSCGRPWPFTRDPARRVFMMHRCGKHCGQRCGKASRVGRRPSSPRAAVEATLCGLVPADRVEHDLLAQAINDSFVEDGTNHPVPYFNELEPERGSTTG